MKLNQSFLTIILLCSLACGRPSHGQSTYRELTLDRTWGVNGTADFRQTDTPTQSPRESWIQKDGKLVVVVGDSPARRLVRFQTNGEIDRSFGTLGELPLGSNGTVYPLESEENAALLQEYVSAKRTRVYRITGAGAFDKSYGGGKGFVDLIDPNIGDGFSGDMGIFLLSRAERNWMSVQWGYRERTLRVIRLNLAGEPDPTFGKNGTKDYSPPAALTLFEPAFYSGFETKMPDGSTLLLWKNPNEAPSETVSGYAITRFDENGNWDTNFGRGGILTGADIRFGLDRAEFLTPLADGKLLITGNALWKDQVGLQWSVWRLDGFKLDSSFGTAGIVKAFGGEPDADPALDYLCPQQSWFASTVTVKFVREDDEKTAPQVSLCRNGRPIAKPVSLPGRPDGVLPQASGGYSAGAATVSRSGISHHYVVGGIGGVALCGRFTCNKIGNSFYAAKLNADGNLDRQFGGGPGYVDWVSRESAKTTEAIQDITTLPNGETRILSTTLSVPKASFERLESASLVGLTPSGQLVKRFSFDSPTLFSSAFSLYTPLGSRFSDKRAGPTQNEPLWTSEGRFDAGQRVRLSSPPAPSPWQFTSGKEISPRQDGRAWVRDNIYYAVTDASGNTTYPTSSHIWLAQADGTPNASGVDGNIAVTFPPDGTQPNTIATFADDGLLLVSAPAKGAVRLTRWTPAGKYDASWGEAGGTRVDVRPADATGAELIDYPGKYVYATIAGDFWITLSYNLKIGSVYETRSALVFVPQSGRNPKVIQTPDEMGAGKPRPDGRFSYTKSPNAIVSVSASGAISTDYVPRQRTSFYSAFAYQPDGKLLVASDGFVSRFDTSTAPAPAPTSRTVTEFYNTTLNHYFVTANESEKGFIASGGAGPGWSRTNVEFSAWDQGWANAGASGAAVSKPVYRFYGTPGVGPNSHFYTVVETENLIVRKDPGWKFEEISFYAVEPNADKTCPDATLPVYRVYNNRAAQNDSNHRYLLSRVLEAQMVAKGWVAEGVTLCAASAQ
jgi:uncharacterized delta-60 repeat protein